MDYENLEQFKQIVDGFMRYHNLMGIELLFNYTDDKLTMRACGRGMVHPEGTALAGLELWESINDMLRPGDKVKF